MRQGLKEGSNEPLSVYTANECASAYVNTT